MVVSKYPLKVYLLREFYKYSKNNPQSINIEVYFSKLVDNGSYSLKDWVESLEYFNNWCLQNNMILDLKNKLDYISCCGESKDESDSSLVERLEFFISQYGVDLAVKNN